VIWTPQKRQKLDPHLRGPARDEFHLAIIIPSMNMVHMKFVIDLLSLRDQLDTFPIGKHQSVRVQNRQSSMLPSSRQNLVDDALESDPKPTHVLMLDSDMTFPADSVHWLVHRNEPVVLANYVQRAVPTIPVTRDLDGRLLATTEKCTGLQPIRFGGGGIILIEAEVLRKLTPPLFHFTWRKNPKTGRLYQIGEDAWFFAKVHALGYTPYVDHDFSKHVGHLGDFEYTNRMAYVGEDEEFVSDDGLFRDGVQEASFEEFLDAVSEDGTSAA